MIVLLLFFLSDLLRNILKSICSPYSTLMTMHLPSAVLCRIVLYPFNHVLSTPIQGPFSLCILDRYNILYMQDNLPTELSKRTIFII